MPQTGPAPSAAPARLLLATNSGGKLRELRAIFAGVPCTLLSPADAGVQLDPEETGATLRENAVLKATAFARASGLLSLADDSGLEVDALGGEPGVHSHRYAGPGATDADRIALLLARLRGVPEGQRSARFRCVMALAAPGAPGAPVGPDGLIGTVEGVCEGRITFEPRGTNGFGFDPVFWLPERGRTMAALADDEKHAISHRGRAGVAARRLILAWLSNGSRDEPE